MNRTDRERVHELEAAGRRVALQKLRRNAPTLYEKLRRGRFKAERTEAAIVLKELEAIEAERRRPEIERITRKAERRARITSRKRKETTMTETINTVDAAEYLGISDSLLRRYAREGRLGTKDGRGFVFTKAELDAFNRVERKRGRRWPKKGVSR